MENRMEELLAKYGTVDELLKRAARVEKDNFLFNRLLLLESYNERPLGDQHALDAYMRLNYSKGLGDAFVFDDKDPYLSPFAELNFQGGANIIYSEYDTESLLQIDFSSILQFFDFHSAMLFFDRDLAKNILKTESYSKGRIIYPSIKGFDIRLWRRYRIKIMVEAAKSALSTNIAFANALSSSSISELVYISNLTFWGGDENYWGKVLTREKNLVY